MIMKTIWKQNREPLFFPSHGSCFHCYLCVDLADACSFSILLSIMRYCLVKPEPMCWEIRDTQNKNLEDPMALYFRQASVRKQSTSEIRCNISCTYSTKLHLKQCCDLLSQLFSSSDRHDNKHCQAPLMSQCVSHFIIQWQSRSCSSPLE